MKPWMKGTALAVVLLAAAGAAVYRYGLETERSTLYTGTVEVTTADVTSKTAGYIEGLYMDEGDQVEKGKPAAQIRRDDLTAASARDLASARAARASWKAASSKKEAAEAEALLARENLRRGETLLSADAISRQQMDQLRSAHDAAEAGVRSAKESESAAAASAEAAEQAAAASAALEADTWVYQPLSGLVLTRNFEPGEFVQAGAAIATVADLSDAWVRVYVPQEEMSRLHVGDEADVFTDGQDGRTFKGRIKEIRGEAEYTPRQSISPRERANMVFAVKVQLENEDGLFKPGMIADVRLGH